MWCIRHRKRDSVVLFKKKIIVVGTLTDETGQKGLARNDTIVREETELSVLILISWGKLVSVEK